MIVPSPRVHAAADERLQHGAVEASGRKKPRFVMPRPVARHVPASHVPASHVPASHVSAPHVPAPHVSTPRQVECEASLPPPPTLSGSAAQPLAVERPVAKVTLRPAALPASLS